MITAFQTGLYIGSFQPVLRGHVANIAGALEVCDRVIVGLSGHRSAPSAQRPWSTDQRRSQIYAALPDGIRDRVTVIALRDHLYQPARWVSELRAALGGAGVDLDSVALLASQAEADALRLRGLDLRVRLAPVAPIPPTAEAGARQDYLRGGEVWRAAVPEPVARWLDQFKSDPAYARLTEEQAWVDALAASWRAAPYPPIFVTADAIVLSAGHALVVRRSHAPARGLWALPGGFVEQDETVVEAALRELIEETGIDVPLDALRRAARGSAVFDHPQRSLRGRTITHGLLIDLGDAGPPPMVRAGDDAGAAEWWPLERLAQADEIMAEDHAWILRAFLPNL